MTQESFYRHRKHRGEPGHTHGTHGRAHTSTWMTDHSSTQKNPPIQTFYRYHDRYSTGTVPVVGPWLFSVPWFLGRTLATTVVIQVGPDTVAGKEHWNVARLAPHSNTVSG